MSMATKDSDWAEAGRATNVNPDDTELAATAAATDMTTTDWTEGDTEKAEAAKAERDAGPQDGRHVRTMWPWSSLKIGDREITSEWTHVADADLELVRQTAADHDVPLEEKGVDEEQATPHAPPVA
jgi:hypothetical protein